MHKALIFDWSGTLSDNFHLFCKVCNSIFTHLGRDPISVEEIRNNIISPYMLFWNKYFPDLTMEKQNKLFEKYTHLTGHPDLFPDVDETIKLLHEQGWKLFVVSSDPTSKLVPTITRHNLLNFFDKIVGGVHEKSEDINLIIKEYNLNKNQCYYIGDSVGDIKAGKIAGIKTIGITWGFESRKTLQRVNPDFLIDNIKELKKIC